MKNIVSPGNEIYNSDVFQVLYEYEISRSKRYPSPLTLLRIEMKPSASNDDLLGTASTVFTSALNAHLRSVDIPSGRGNLYSVLLPTSNQHGARVVCERLLSVFKSKFDVPNGSITFQVHIGASAHDGGSTMSGESILQKADEALQQSKRKGPNTYVMLS